MNDVFIVGFGIALLAVFLIALVGKSWPRPGLTFLRIDGDEILFKDHEGQIRAMFENEVSARIATLKRKGWDTREEELSLIIFTEEKKIYG